MAITYGNNFDFSFLYDSPIFKLQQELKNLSGISEAITKLQSMNSVYPLAQQAVDFYNSSLEFKQFNDTYKAIYEAQQSCQRTMQTWSAIAKEVAESRSKWEATLHEIDLILKTYQAIRLKSERHSAVHDATKLIQEVDSVELPEETELQRQASEIADADKERIVDEVSDAIHQENWEQRLMALFLTYQTQHPVFAWLIKGFLVSILSGIISTLICNRFIGSVDKTTYLREDPASSAPVVVVIDKPQDIIILGDVPYYYYVEFHDSSSTEPIHGYISKRSLKNVHPEDPQSDTETKNE